MTFLDDNSFIWTSEKDGFNHIYWYSKAGKLINQVTKGNWEVTEYYGFDEKNKTVFYQSTENGSINRDVYRISLDGKNKTRLSQNLGTNAATFSPNFQYFINSFSSAVQPTTYTLNDSKDRKTNSGYRKQRSIGIQIKSIRIAIERIFCPKNRERQ